VWLVLLAVVALAGVIAVVASRGGDDSADTTDDATGSTALAAAETRPVQVTGPPLPRYTGEPDPATGRAFPRVEGASFDGSPVAIGADGRARVMVFVAHWCPHCQREVPRLSEYLQDNPMPADVDLLTVATGTTSDRPNYPPSEWLEREKWPGPVLADSEDGKAAAAFGLSSYPFFVAADKEGNVVARTAGELTTDQFAQLVQLARG
jgi:thiol-disulfide isomerase/thioredoxin